MRKIEPEIITGMGYIGDNPGVLYRMGGAGEQTVVTGNPALLEGVKGSRFTSLAIYGKSTQGSTTGAQLFDIGNEFVSQEKGGVTFTVENNEIVVNGTATSSVDLFSKKVFWEKLTPGEYTFTIQNSPDVRLILNMDSKVYQTSEGAMTVKITPESTISYFIVRISQNSTFNNYRLKIMLNAGSGGKQWEPYTGGAPSPSPSYPQDIESAGQSGEISVKVGRTEMDKNPQVVIIPTSGGLPGIPVSSGGNYTDKDGQQWGADEIDLARGERVQRIEKLDLKSLLWSKQSRASNASGFWFSSRIKSASLFGANVKGTISNIGRLGNPYNMIGDYVWAITNAGNSEIRIGFADSTIDSLEKLTNLLNSLPEAYAMYCLAEPIRTPLPPETIAAYKKLHTYSPTTTVINDAGAGMIVGYKRRK